MAARHEEGCCEEIILNYFPVGKDLSNDDVGVATGTVLQQIRPVS